MKNDILTKTPDKQPSLKSQLDESRQSLGFGHARGRERCGFGSFGYGFGSGPRQGEAINQRNPYLEDYSKSIQYESTSITSEELQELLGNEEQKDSLKELVIGDGCCNDLREDLVIEGFHNLKKIVILKNSLRNITSLKIQNNENLKEIEIDHAKLFLNSCLSNVQPVVFDNLPELTSISIGKEALVKATNITLSSNFLFSLSF